MCNDFFKDQYEINYLALHLRHFLRKTNALGPNFCSQMAGNLHKSTYLDHQGHLLRILFKIMCYFAYRSWGRFANLRFLGSGKARYDLEIVFFQNTYHLKFFSSSNGKCFLKKIENPSEIFWI